MQATTPNPSAPVIAKAFQGATSVTVTGADGKMQTLMVPRSAGEMTELMARRRELTDELDNVTERRNDVVMQLRTAPNVAQAGLTAQLQVLNNRIVQLETDLAATERQLSAASPELATITQPPPAENVDDQVEEGMAAGAASMFVVMGALLLFLRRRWKRRDAARVAPLPDDSTPRLMRLEQGMEAIAIEVERISEGQRFVTKLLSESPGVSSPAHRIGEPVTAKARDQAR